MGDSGRIFESGVLDSILIHILGFYVHKLNAHRQKEAQVKSYLVERWHVSGEWRWRITGENRDYVIMELIF